MDLSAAWISVRQITTKRDELRYGFARVQCTLESGIIRSQTRRHCSTTWYRMGIVSMGISTCASLLQNPVPLALEPLKRICEIAYRPPTHSFSSLVFLVSSFLFAPNRKRDNFPLRWDDMEIGGPTRRRWQENARPAMRLSLLPPK